MERTNRHNIIAERFEALRPRLRAWASRLLGNDSDADDALQEAFFRLWRRRDDDCEQSDAVNFTAVRCACIDILRKRAVRASEPIDAAEAIAPASEAESLADMADEVNALIDSRLDNRQKELLLMHDSMGYDYPEIAERLNITEANARVILSRARKTIREAYRQKVKFH